MCQPTKVTRNGRQSASYLAITTEPFMTFTGELQSNLLFIFFIQSVARCSVNLMVTTKKLLFPRFEFAFYSYPSGPLRFSPCPVGHLGIRIGESTVSRFLAFMLDVSSCRFASFRALQNMSLTDRQNRGIKRSPLSRWDVTVRLMHHDPSDFKS